MDTAPLITGSHEDLCRELQLQQCRLSPAHLLGFSVNGTPIRKALLLLLAQNGEDALVLLKRQAAAVRARSPRADESDPAFFTKDRASRERCEKELAVIRRELSSLANLNEAEPSLEDFFPDPFPQPAHSV